MDKKDLFKAKKIGSGEWVVGNRIDDVSTGKVFIRPVETLLTQQYNDHNITNMMLVAYEVDPETICRCTGLCDKKDTLIWENDIIKKEFYTDYDVYADSRKYIGTVPYEECGWCVNVKDDDKRPYVIFIIEALAYTKDVEHFEVIGNIYDNPALLENKPELEEEPEM